MRTLIDRTPPFYQRLNALIAFKRSLVDPFPIAMVLAIVWGWLTLGGSKAAPIPSVTQQTKVVRIRGEVVDEQGQPVPHAIVQYERRWNREPLVARANAHGLFMIAVPIDEDRGSGVLESHIVAMDASQSKVGRVDHHDWSLSLHKVFRMEIAPFRQCTIRVTGNDQKPVVDAEVQAMSEGHAIAVGRTNADGTVVLKYPWQTEIQFVWGFRDGIGSDFWFHREPASPLPDSISLSFRGAVEAAIQILDTNQKPLADVDAWLSLQTIPHGPMRVRSPVSSDREGWIRWPWIPREGLQEIDITLMHPTHFENERPQWSYDSLHKPIKVTMMEGARVVVDIVDEDNLPMADTLVLAEAFAPTLPRSNGMQCYGITDRNGHLEFLSIPEMAGTLKAISRSRATKHVEFKPEPKAPVTSVVVGMRSGTRIGGSLSVGEANVPGADQWIVVTQVVDGQQKHHEFLKTSELGEFSVCVEPGIYTIRDTWNTQQTMVTVTDQEAILCEFHWDRWPLCKYVGSIVDGKGNLIRGAHIQSLSLDSNFRTGFRATSDNGGFVRGQRANDRLLLWATDASSELAAWHDLQQNMVSFQVVLTPAVSVKGNLVDAQGSPRANQELRIIFQPLRHEGTHDWIRSFSIEVVSDSEGRFQVPGIPVGSRIEISSESMRLEKVVERPGVLDLGALSQVPRH